VTGMEIPAPTAGLGAPAWGGFDPARTRGRGLADARKSFAVSARLGWQMEANWTDPVLFLIYSVAKPVSSALILVFMLEVISGGSRPDYRAFIVIGSALWSFVLSGIAGLAWTVLDDRERYRMLRYVYVSPSDFLVVLLGRGIARIAVGAMGAAITLAVGVVALGVPFDLGRIDWPLLIVVMTLGIGAIIALGILLAAGQVIGLVTPLTWWLEGVRVALFPGGLTAVGGDGSTFAALTGHTVPTGIEIVLALLLTGTVATLASIAVFRISDRRAKDRGLLDQTTGS
jgi:ABC-2 type transport system permease protein